MKEQYVDQKLGCIEKLQSDSPSVLPNYNFNNNAYQHQNIENANHYNTQDTTQIMKNITQDVSVPMIRDTNGRPGLRNFSDEKDKSM